MALTLKSERMIQAEILSRLISQLGLNDVNPGSVIDVLTQAVAQQDFALYYQIAQVSRLVDIDALTGTDLENKAFEYGLTKLTAQKTKGTISIQRASDFVKVSTTFYAGSPSPIAGDTQIDVNDASSTLLSTSGTLIIGRGTNNEEEVDYSSAPVDNSTYWRITLDSALTKDHATEETVILKQGDDEVIVAGTIVVVAATGVNAEIKFQLDNDTTLLSGEDQVEDVEITAIVAGSAGNIPVGAITGSSAFPSSPFDGARARNTRKFTSGRDIEADDELRDRIKNYIQGITKAVKQAILNAIVGLVDPETAKRVVSASIVLPQSEAGAVKVYIDDGTGFEPSFESQGFETVLSSARGGEERLQVDRFPIAKAQLETNLEEPFNMSSGSLTLTFEVGTLQETITFDTADFRFPEIATAEELVAAINDKATLIEARTSQVGKKILITAKRDTNESIQVTGGTSNTILNFPLDRKDTINLYVDDVKKSKDGQTATIDSANQAPYNLDAVGAFPHLLNIVVDGKTANPQVATFNEADAADPTAVTAAEICTVLNRELVGIVATPIADGTKVRIESLTKLSSSSKLNVTDVGGLNDAADGLGFATGETVGTDGDYTFNRELGIIEFATPLTRNQNVTLGSIYTRAKLRASLPELYSPANGTTLVIEPDEGTEQTITFDGTFAAGKTAEETADFINQTLVGATAIARVIGGLSYLEIYSNSYENGALQIVSSSTANSSFEFTLDQIVTSGTPNKAYLLAQITSPYNFAEADTLVTVIDNDIVNNTFSIPMTYPGEVSLAVSTTVFRDSSLSNIFQENNLLVDYYIAFKNGLNTLSGTVESVADMGSNVMKYTFNPVPASFSSFNQAGELFKIEGLDDSENNGYFVVQSAGADYVEVLNPDGVNASGQTGSAVISLRKQITAYTQSNGSITVGSAFDSAPIAGDEFIVIPSTVQNLVEYINNTKITSFTLKGVAESASDATVLQLSSKSEGSDGYIQVTGGNANRELQFSTDLYRGLQAYSYWTGLLALVHKTIYGDDSDLTSYPGVGASGVIFRVLAPTVRNIEVELDITLQEGVSIAAVENEVKSAVTGYVNTLGVGEDVIIERIRAAVIAIPGIVDVVINTPTANIVIADNERADVADPDILIG